jgi:preprotein translocase YajC subunit
MLKLLLEGEAPKNTGSYIIMIVLIVAIVGLFIWQSYSNKKRQKKAQDMVNSLKISDRIKTIGGICGFLVEVNNDENTIVIETGTNDKKSYVKLDKAAIYQTGPANPGAPETAPVKEEVKAEEKVEEKTEETK